MARLLAMASEVAESSASVLITGASGTGKELLARAIHAISGRRERPFVPVDCGAIPEGLLESELFGHRRGAFTGAVADKAGIVEGADGGTLFLDEVGNLPAPMQAKLLRFLQDRRFRRVGETVERAVDARLVSASNRDLRELVGEGSFREDLYYRLAVISLDIPPLRDRREDIPPLVYHFIRRFNEGAGYAVEGVRQDALDLLIDHSWSGNVRELENIVERAVILRKAGLVQPSDLPPEVAPTPSAGAGRSLEEMERQHILQLLEECGGNRSRVARILGISRRTVYRKLRQYGIDPEG
jgi:transcriptional regulator with PAS, ATPase and Fis domain